MKNFKVKRLGAIILTILMLMVFVGPNVMAAEDQGPCASEGIIGNGVSSAGFTREGRLCTLWYPYVAAYTFVEYHTSDAAAEYLGAAKEQGSFAALRIGGTFSWLMKRPDWSQTVSYDGDNSGVLKITYTKSGTTVTETAFMCSDRNVLVRSFDVKNTSASSQTYAFDYYSLFDINENHQSFTGWSGTDCYGEYDSTSQTLVWNGPTTANKYGVAVGSDGSYTISKKCTGIKDALWDPDAYECCEQGQVNTGPQYYAKSPNGYMEWDLGSIAAGSSKSITMFIACGNSKSDAITNYTNAKNTGYTTLLGTTNNYWTNWIASANVPSGLTGTQLQAYKRALITLRMNTDSNCGAVTAAPTIQPQYHPVWTRDGSYNVIALARAGYVDLAKKFYDTWLPGVQEADGHWKQCHNMDKAYVGVVDVENDQIPTAIWGVYTTWKLSGDNTWVSNRWTMVKNAADYWVNNCIDSNNYNLAKWTCDYKENPLTDVRSSLYTNAAAISGLRCAAAIADYVGDTTRAANYRAKANLVYDGLSHLWDASANAYYTADGATGLYHNLVECAGDQMVICWPYNVLPVTDSKAIGTANYIENYLSTTTDNIWLPMRLMMVNYWKKYGDNTKALNHINYALNNRTDCGWIAEVVTSTGQKQWAKPLSWSQSQYVLGILHYYGVELPLPPTN